MTDDEDVLTPAEEAEAQANARKYGTSLDTERELIAVGRHDDPGCLRPE